jgi:hypothetical protein
MVASRETTLGSVCTGNHREGVPADFLNQEPSRLSDIPRPVFLVVNVSDNKIYQTRQSRRGVKEKFQTSNFQVARQRRDVLLQKSNP